jgi:acyl-coenzyme A synthetase/AMP-(fatty) acid ligase
MVLAIHSDAGYLNKEGARSHAFLSENVTNPSNNSAIYNEASIIKAVMSSAAEAKIGALYINARKGVKVRNILEEMGHPKPPTPVQTDDSTAESIVNLRVQPKCTKAMDMHFHWLRDRGINQKQFKFYWRLGTSMQADYWTKHHSPSHHHQIRNEISTSYQVVMDLRS